MWFNEGCYEIYINNCLLVSHKRKSIHEGKMEELHKRFPQLKHSICSLTILNRGYSSVYSEILYLFGS